MSEDNMLHLLLVGKRGCGKSSTGNTILGQDLFKCGVTVDSPASSSTKVSGTHNGTNIEVTEFPGLFDTSTTDEKEAAAMVHTITLMHPGPTAFLYIISLGDRYTERDRGFYERLKALLGQYLTKYIIIIFTRGDDLKRKNETIEDVLSTAPSYLKELLEECGERYVVFDNTAEDKQRQVSSLLEEVRKLSQMYSGRPYTCPWWYGKEGEKMEKEVAMILRKVEEEEVKDKKYVQKLEEKTKHAQEEAEREFERKERELQELMCKDFEERINRLESVVLEILQSSLKLFTANEKCQKYLDYLMKIESERNKQMKDLERKIHKDTEVLRQKQELDMERLNEMYKMEVDRLRQELSETHSGKHYTHATPGEQREKSVAKGWVQQRGGDKMKQPQEEAERETEIAYPQIQNMSKTMNESNIAITKNSLKDMRQQSTENDKCEGAVGYPTEKKRDKVIQDFGCLRQDSFEVAQSKHENPQDYPQVLKVEMETINQPQVDHPLGEGHASQPYTCPTDSEVGKTTKVTGSTLEVKEEQETSHDTQELMGEEKQKATDTVKEKALNGKPATKVEVKMEGIRRNAEERENRNKQVEDMLKQLASKRMSDIDKEEYEMEVL